MSPGEIDPKVISQRALWILQMVEAIKDLHPEEKALFLKDRHKVAAAESYLRRALEALFDMGRHILAKRFAYPATEYKEIVTGLSERKILGEQEAALMRNMAGYQNRMVHFNHEITPKNSRRYVYIISMKLDFSPIQSSSGSKNIRAEGPIFKHVDSAKPSFTLAIKILPVSRGRCSTSARPSPKDAQRGSVGTAAS